MKISVRIPNCDIYLTNAMGSPELKSVPVALAINIGSVVELLERTRHLIDAGSTPRFVVFTNAAVAVVDQDMRLGRQYIVGVPRFRSPARLWMLNGVCDLRFSSSRDLLLWFVTAAVTATQGDIEVISAKSIRTRVLSLARTRL